MSTGENFSKKRIPTGIPGLDTVLNSGFLEGRIYLVVGRAGTGKTILGNQTCFHHVATGGRAVFLTLLSETSTQMISNMEEMTFFDRAAIGHQLYYFSGYSALQEGGLDGLLTLIAQILTSQKPTLLVMDGMLYIEALAGSIIPLKEFIQTAHALLEANRCTVLLLTNATDSRNDSVVGTTVDGLVELGDRLIGSRAVRDVEVTKLRGTDYLRGRHRFEITNAGIVVHPRLESVLKPRGDKVVGELTKLSTGVSQLDQMLHGGLPAGSTTLVFGAPGSGKTLLGTTFVVAGAQNKEAGLYFGFSETPSRLIAKVNPIGIDLGQVVEEGHVELLWQPALEDSLDALGERLLQAIRQRQVQRVFIDDLAGF